jgi:hypothetical protein
VRAALEFALCVSRTGIPSGAPAALQNAMRGESSYVSFPTLRLIAMFAPRAFGQGWGEVTSCAAKVFFHDRAVHCCIRAQVHAGQSCRELANAAETFYKSGSKTNPSMEICE